MGRAILTLAAAGAPVPEVLADELARAVLEDAVAVKAREVQAGGPHKLLRAIELAEMVGVEVQGREGAGAEAASAGQGGKEEGLMTSWRAARRL